MKKGSLLKKAFWSTLPVMAGYLVLGMGFGMLMLSKGFSFLWTPAMSLFIYAGSMQFAAISLLSEGASFLTVGLTTFLVNARHIFYGISMVEEYRDLGRKKPYLIFTLTDETYSLVVSGGKDLPPEDRKCWYFLVSLLDHIWWVSGSLLGAIAGSLIKINTKGLDFALTALFVSIFVDQWISCKGKEHFPALVGLGAATLCLLIFGPESFLIPSMLLIFALLFIPKKEEKAE